MLWIAPGPSMLARTKVSPGPICTLGEIFQPRPRSLAARAPVPAVAMPPCPGAPEKFSGLMDRVRAWDSRARFPSPMPSPLKSLIPRVRVAANFDVILRRYDEGSVLLAAWPRDA